MTHKLALRISGAVAIVAGVALLYLVAWLGPQHWAVCVNSVVVALLLWLGAILWIVSCE